MLARLQQAWYSDARWVWCLSLLSGLFWLLSSLRRQLFKIGVLPSSDSEIPTVVVGNIGIGGNGKTPLVLALVESLRNRGYHPAVLSRGYGGSHTRFPHIVNAQNTAEQVGDEPALIFKRQSCIVVIDPVRVRGVKYILENTIANVVICDDGLQHYAMKRDIEICVLDKRGVGNGYLLPMGPLREGRWRLKQVDAIVRNIGYSGLDYSDEHGENKEDDVNNGFNMSLQPSCWVNILTQQESSLTDFAAMIYGQQKQQSQNETQIITALAGIGDPKRFFDTLHTMHIIPDKMIPFADHHQFVSGDIPTDGYVLMTEKDAIKCVGFDNTNAWYLRIDARLNEAFYALIESGIEDKAKRLANKRNKATMA